MDPDKDGTVSQEEMLDFMRGRSNLRLSIRRSSLLIQPARLGTAVLAEDEAAVPVLRRVGVGHTTEHIA